MAKQHRPLPCHPSAPLFFSYCLQMKAHNPFLKAGVIFYPSDLNSEKHTVKGYSTRKVWITSDSFSWYQLAKLRRGGSESASMQQIWLMIPIKSEMKEAICYESQFPLPSNPFPVVQIKHKIALPLFLFIFLLSRYHIYIVNIYCCNQT